MATKIRSRPSARSESRGGSKRSTTSSDSTSACQMSRRRLAPRADRTARSRSRAVARVSSRLATLAHAISNTANTAPSNTHAACLRILHLAVAQRAHAQVHFAAKTRRRQAERVVEQRLQLRGGLRTVMPGFKRANTYITRPGSALRCSASSSACGTTTSACSSAGISKSRGSTPITRTWAPSISMSRFTIAGIAIVVARPKRIRNQRDLGPFRPVFFGKKVAAQDRRNAQRGQEIRFHARATQMRRIVLRQITGIHAGFRSERREGPSGYRATRNTIRPA